MKKASLMLLLVTAVIVAVLVYRTATVFTDQQVPPAEGMINPGLDTEAAVRRFATALTFPTISHDDRTHFDAGAFSDLRNFLQTAYPLVHQQAERTLINEHSLLFHLPGRDPALKPVLFMSHMDVVPIEEVTRPDWTHPPFAGVVENGIIWGRGSLDDKIGVMALLEATEQLLEEGTRPERSVYLAFGHDEEVGGDGGAKEIAQYLVDRNVRFDFVMDEGGAITQGLIEGIDNEVAVIGISEKGYANLRLTVNAPGGHSSQPPAQTGLGILSRAIVKIEDNPFPADVDPLMITFGAVGDRTPWKTRLAMANLWLFSPLVERTLLSDQSSAAGIRTTTAATMITGSPKANILPTRAEAIINFRILPGESVETVAARVIDLVDDPRVTVTVDYGTNPSPVSPVDTRGYELIASTIRGMDEDILVAPYMVRGGTDAKYFYSVSDNVYRFLMIRVDGETMQYVHGIDERVTVDGFLEAIRFYYHLLQRSMQS